MNATSADKPIGERTMVLKAFSRALERDVNLLTGFLDLFSQWSPNHPVI
jgi:hypothetical protein